MKARTPSMLVALGTLFAVATGCANADSLVEECAEASSIVDDICDLDPDSDERQATLNECSEQVGYAKGRRCLAEYARFSSCAAESLPTLNDCEELNTDLAAICAYEQGLFAGCIEDE